MHESRQDGPQGPAGPRWRHVPAWLVWLALGAAIAAAAWLMPWRTAWAALLEARKVWIAAALAVCLAGTPITATEWGFFLPRRYRLAWRRVFGIVAMTVTARASLPFLAGDASGAGLLVMRGGLDPGAAVLVLTLDQLFTGLGKVAMVCATLVFARLPPFLVAGGAALVVLVLVFLVLMLAASVSGGVLHGLAVRLPARAARWLRGAADLTAHLEILRSPSRTAVVLALVGSRKLIEVGVTLAVQRALGIALPPWSAVLVVTAVNLAAVIPGPPSGLGVFEATALLTYRFLGVPPGMALAAAILQHAVYFATDLGYGYALLAAEAVRRRRPG